MFDSSRRLDDRSSANRLSRDPSVPLKTARRRLHDHVMFAQAADSLLSHHPLQSGKTEKEFIPRAIENITGNAKYVATVVLNASKL